MKKGLVSVFIPSYNYAGYIGSAIESILAQSYADWELIVVDDASTDDSPALIEHYAARHPGRIRAILLKSNGGQSAATNIGLQHAHGEFVSFLAADDVARPHRLEEGVALLRQQPQVAAAFSRVAYIDADGRPLPVAEDVFNRNFEDMRWQMLEGNFLCATSAVARLPLVRDAGRLHGALDYVEDYDLWLRLLDRHELVRTDSIWVDYRLHGKNLSLAQSRDEQRLGPLYESVGAAVRAMQRWHPERLGVFRHRPGTAGYERELAAVELRLADTCLRLDRSFFGQLAAYNIPSPALGTAAAYSFVLSALQRDPDNGSAREILHSVFRAFGDHGRADGGDSTTLAELAKAARHEMPAAAAPARQGGASPPAQLSPYESWLQMLEITRTEASQYDRLIAAGRLRTRFHLATVVRPGEEDGLAPMLNSMTRQLHGNLLLTIVAASEAPPGFASERLRWVRAAEFPLVAASQSLGQEDADWVGLIRCGDLLADSALLVIAEAIERHPEWQAIYTDDDTIDADGHSHSPRLKPDFDATLLRSTPYTTGLVVTRRDVFCAVGGYDDALIEVAEYDLMLRLAERSDHGAIGHVAAPQLHRRANRVLDATAAREALQKSAGTAAATIAAGPIPGSCSIQYRAPEQPLVSLVVPTCDRLPMLSRLIETLLGKTAYANYEIVVVDHGSAAADAIHFLAGLESLGESRVRVHRLGGRASLAKAFNAGAREASGSLLLFMHDDVAIVHPEWLDRIVEHALRPGIGAVGARLLTSGGRLQHAGIILGMSGIAELAGGSAPMDDPGYLGRHCLDQEASAVSAACMLVRRNAFETIGGFDEAGFPHFLTDVDLCLRLGKTGWRIVWTPGATLLHDGPLKLAEGIRSAPMSPAERSAAWTTETRLLLQRWLPKLARDPHYSRLHSLRPPPFTPCADPLLVRDALPWKPLPRILAQPADRHGSGHYRISAPLRALAMAGKVQAWDTMDFYLPVEVARIEPDTVVFQRPYTDAQYAYLEQMAGNGSALRLFDLDDLITRIPQKSMNRGSFPPDLATRLERAATLCDRLVVSTQPLAHAIRSWHDDIRVVPNRLPREPWMQFNPRRRIAARPRVGWAGAIGHEGDLAIIGEVIERLAGEVDWILLGHCPDALRSHVREIHPLVPIADYPSALAALELDLAIAPLESNSFNEAKSSLKLLEYGILGYPVVCTDILPYQGGFPVTRVPNRPQDWIAAIRDHINDLDAAARRGDELREHVRTHWMLEDHLDQWLGAWSP